MSRDLCGPPQIPGGSSIAPGKIPPVIVTWFCALPIAKISDAIQTRGLDPEDHEEKADEEKRRRKYTETIPIPIYSRYPSRCVLFVAKALGGGVPNARVPSYACRTGLRACRVVATFPTRSGCPKFHHWVGSSTFFMDRPMDGLCVLPAWMPVPLSALPPPSDPAIGFIPKGPAPIF